MRDTWKCPSCETVNGMASLRCGCGFGGSIPNAEVPARAVTEESCSKNELYREMLARAAKLKDLPREELVAMAKKGMAEFVKNAVVTKELAK